MGRLPESAAVVVRERARLLAAPLFELGRDFELRVTTNASDSGDPVGVCFEASDGFAASDVNVELGRGSGRVGSIGVGP